MFVLLTLTNLLFLIRAPYVQSDKKNNFKSFVIFCDTYFKRSVFQGGTSGKESVCQCRRPKRCGFDPWVRMNPWSRKWQPTSVFLSRKFHGQRSQWGSVHVAAKSQKRMSDWACVHTHAHARTHTHTHFKRSGYNGRLLFDGQFETNLENRRNWAEHPCALCLPLCYTHLQVHTVILLFLLSVMRSTLPMS